MDGTSAVWIGLGLTAIVQVAGVAFFWGTTSQKLRDLGEKLDGHIKLPSSRAHGRDQ